MTYEEAAIKTMVSDGEQLVWVGAPDVWHGIYRLKNGHNDRHPITQWKAVYSALKRSRKFRVRGYLKAPGFTTSREIGHPVFELACEN